MREYKNGQAPQPLLLWNSQSKADTLSKTQGQTQAELWGGMVQGRCSSIHWIFIEQYKDTDLSYGMFALVGRPTLSIKSYNENYNHGGFPGGLVVRTLHFYCLVPGVQSLVSERRSHKPCSMAE